MIAATASRRSPTQRRSQQTVKAMLEAVLRILKREGFDAVTTNRIAEVAGVSIGSVYQYFPNKRAIFIALHTRHVEQIDRVIQTALVEKPTRPCRNSSMPSSTPWSARTPPILSCTNSSRPRYRTVRMARSPSPPGFMASFAWRSPQSNRALAQPRS